MTIGFARAEKLGTVLAALAVLALALLLVFGATPARAGEAVQIRLFGSSESANADITPFPKWTGVLQRYAEERRLEDAPCAGRCPLQEWKAFVARLQGKDRLGQLDAVNAYVNRTPYQSDSSRYGMVDYWATPREFLGRAGDCEDYVIAKYLALRKLGWSAGELRLVVLQDENRRELHAVLVAYHGGTAYVLDNLSASVREHAAIRHYRPIFSINEQAWYFHRDWNPATAVDVSQARPLPAPEAQLVGAVPPAIDTTRPAAAPAPAVGGRESLAVLFSDSAGR